jgi:hypothetical protein
MAELSMGGHFLAERRHFFGEIALRLGAVLGTGFGEGERAAIELEGSQRPASPVPMESSGDHQVDDQPETVVKFHNDVLADARTPVTACPRRAMTGGSTQGSRKGPRMTAVRKLCPAMRAARAST